MTPAVSIIIPIYNVEPWLRPCLDSALGQTLRDIEVILVDDGSTDGSAAICDEYAARDGRVRVIHKENGGVMQAVIDGIRASSAPYVGFMDGDDWADPGFFQELYDCAAQTGADLVIGQHINDHPDGSSRPSPHVYTRTEVREGGQTGRELAEQFLSRGWTGCQSMDNSRCDKLHRRELLVQNIPYYDPDLAMGEDFIALAAELPDCRKAVFLNAPSRYHYRQRAGSATQVYTERTIFSVDRVADDLTRIGREKGLDMTVVRANIGERAYSRLFTIAGAEGLSSAQRRADMRRILAMTPPDALRAYAHARRSPVPSAFLLLFRMGLVGPCLALVRLFSRFQNDGPV